MVPFLFCPLRLCWADSACWTYISTSTAISTYVWINFVDIPFRDSFYWTFVNTSTACDTIVRNYVSHCN